MERKRVAGRFVAQDVAPDKGNIVKETAVATRRAKPQSVQHVEVVAEPGEVNRDLPQNPQSPKRSRKSLIGLLLESLKKRPARADGEHGAIEG